MEFYTFDLATTLRLTLNIMQFKIPIYNSTFQLCILSYLIIKIRCFPSQHTQYLLQPKNKLSS